METNINLFCLLSEKGDFVTLTRTIVGNFLFDDNSMGTRYSDSLDMRGVSFRQPTAQRSD